MIDNQRLNTIAESINNCIFCMQTGQLYPYTLEGSVADSQYLLECISDLLNQRDALLSIISEYVNNNTIEGTFADCTPPDIEVAL